MSQNTPSITLRPITDQDADFLFQLYASTRREELAITDWTEDQKLSFLKMQFDLQNRSYFQNYETRSYSIIEKDHRPIGRLYLAFYDREIRIVDIAILPAYCRQGIGTQLLKDVFAQGDASGRSITIHVECNNPARFLYERLGFQLREDKGVYLFMEKALKNHD